MRPVPISLDVVLVHKTASGNYTHLTGIDHFRSYVNIAVSFLAYLWLRMQRDF